jgi:hypothetical protein
LVWALLALIGCGEGAVERVAPHPPPLPPGHPDRLPLDALSFADEADHMRFVALVQATETQVPETWLRRHVRRADGTISVRWCSPSVPEQRCTTGSMVLMEEAGVAWRAVSVFPTGKGDVLGGLGWEAGTHPASGPWGLAQEQVIAPSRSTRPSASRSTRPSGWWVGARARTDNGVLVVPLGDASTWTIDGVRLRLAAADPDDWVQESGLLATFDAQQAALRKAALAEINLGDDRCVPDRPPRANQGSVSCTPRPLSAERQAALRDDLATVLDARHRAVHKHPGELHKLLIQTRPPLQLPADQAE